MTERGGGRDSAILWLLLLTVVTNNCCCCCRRSCHCSRPGSESSCLVLFIVFLTGIVVAVVVHSLTWNVYTLLAFFILVLLLIHWIPHQRKGSCTSSSCCCRTSSFAGTKVGKKVFHSDTFSSLFLYWNVCTKLINLHRVDGVINGTILKNFWEWIVAEV